MVPYFVVHRFLDAVYDSEHLKVEFSNRNPLTAVIEQSRLLMTAVSKFKIFRGVESEAGGCLIDEARVPFSN